MFTWHEHTPTHTCMHTYTHTHIQTDTHMYGRTCMCVHVYVCKYVSVRVRMCMQGWAIGAMNEIQFKVHTRSYKKNPPRASVGEKIHHHLLLNCPPLACVCTCICVCGWVLTCVGVYVRTCVCVYVHVCMCNRVGTTA